jgi:hypothetical protein
MNIVSVVPYRIVPPVDGGKTLSFGANRALNRVATSFRCIALPVLREPPLKAASPFPYTELRTMASLLIGLERSGLFPKIPYFRALDLYSQRMAEECMVEPCDVVEVSFPWLMGIRKHLPPSIKVVATPGAVVGYESLFNGPVRVGSIEAIPGLIQNVERLSGADVEKLKPFEWRSVAARRLEVYRAVSGSHAVGPP